MDSLVACVANTRPLVPCRDYRLPSDFAITTTVTEVDAFVSQRDTLTDALVRWTAQGWQWRSPP